MKRSFALLAVSISICGWAQNAPNGRNSSSKITAATGNEGGQVNNVVAYGAVTGTTDNAGAFNAAIAECPSSGCTVYVPSETFAFKSVAFVINRANITLQCAPGALLQAQTGFTGRYPILDIQGSAVNVRVLDCAFDGNAVAAYGVSVDGAAQNIWLDNLNIKGANTYGITGYLRTGGDLKVTKCYIHNLSPGAAGYFDIAGATGTPISHLDNNRFDSLSDVAAGATGLSTYEASGNHITNISKAQGALYCYGCDRIDWQKNTFNNNGAAIHCDTCGGGVIAHNTATNDYLPIADIFAEASSNIIVEGNVSTNKLLGSGIVVGSGSTSVGPVTYRTQVLSFNSTSGFTPRTGVTLTEDNTDYKSGTASMVATPSTSFPLGAIWYHNFSSAINFTAGYQDIWIKPSTGQIDAGQFALVCSVSTNLSTHDMVVPIPAIATGTWRRLIQYQPGWEGASGGSGFKSCGLVALVAGITTGVKFDDYDYAAEVIGMKITHNRVIDPQYVGIWLGAAQDAVVQENYVENPVIAHPSGTKSAYEFQNSPGTTFVNNTSNFAVGSTGTTDLTTGGSVVQSLTYVSNFVHTGVTEFSNPADIVGSELRGRR